MADAHLTYAIPAAQALAEAAVGVTLADVNDPDLALVYVNETFTKLTGYPRDEVVGRNCRFLQGPGTDPAAVRRVRDALRARRSTRVTLLNYRRDGTPFHNELVIAPVHDDDGVVTHMVGMQIDVTHSVESTMRFRQERDLLRAELTELSALREVLTPRDIPPVDGLAIAARYMAPGQLAGDFHLVAPGPDGVTLLAIGDAIGHGTGAAQQASFVRASLVTFAAHTCAPDRLLQLANASLIERVGMSGRFATCACIALHPDGRAELALAGHPAPLLLDSGAEAPIADRAPPLGVTLDLQPTCSTFEVGSGEGVLLYTDGLSESRVHPGRAERLGEHRVQQALRDHRGAAPEALLDALLSLTPDLASGTPGDDVCMLALRRV